MKIILLLVFSVGILYSQPYQVKQITDFNFDSRNPTFLNYPHNIPWYSAESEIFFEAVYNDSSSSICLLNYDQPTDSFYQFTAITPLADSNVIHRKTEGRFLENYPDSPLKIVLWETNEKGNWDIAFSVDSGDGWTPYEFMFSSSEDELDLSFIIDPFFYNFEYQFLYTKGKSIYLYTKGDSIQNEIVFEGNDSVKYSDATGAYGGYDGALYIVAVQKVGERQQKLVYRKREIFNSTWSEINTVFERIPSEKPKFIYSNWSNISLAFEITTNRLKRTFLIRPEEFGSNENIIPLMQDPSVENTDLSAFSFPIITENPQEDFYSYHPFTYRFRRNDSTYVRVGKVGYYYYPYDDYYTEVKDSKPNLGPMMTTWEGVLSYSVWEDSSEGKINIFGIKRIDPLGDVDDERIANKDFHLFQNFPNPFNPETTIKYDVRKNTLVKISVCNLLGEQIITLVNEEKMPGIYEVSFNASDLASGIYFYQLKAGEFVQTRKMVLLR